MEITERIFDECFLIELSSREDKRGSLEICFNESEISKMTDGFTIREQRIYTMPRRGTFFGIHFQTEPRPQAKLVSVIRGKGIDYIVDLRKRSDTFGKYRAIELSGDVPRAVYIPSGFGHAFLSTEDDTVQLFAIDEYFVNEYSGVINYKDPAIGLKLPLDDLIMSDRDRYSAFLE